MAGAEARVAISEDLELDFTGLFGDAPQKDPVKTPVEPILEGGEYKTTSEREKPVAGLAGGLEREQAKKLLLDTQRERADREKTLAIYREHQKNTIASSQLQTEILKGIQAGEDIYSLFLKAARAISLMTANSLFYSQIEADIRAIYGRGLQEKPPLQMELQEAQKRLQRLLEAQLRETEPESRERIKRAVEAYKRTIEELQTMIEKTQL